LAAAFSAAAANENAEASALLWRVDGGAEAEADAAVGEEAAVSVGVSSSPPTALSPDPPRLPPFT
jgi:hypothetical protein